MIAERLRTDGDLNILNNYQQNDGRLFGHDNLEMELHAIPSRTGQAVLPLSVAAILTAALVLAARRTRSE